MALSRRDFFQRGLVEALRDAARAAHGVSRPRRAPAAPPGKATPAGRPIPVLRPPGALAEERFLTVCTRCDECMHACPMQAIRPAGPEHGEAARGTPMIEPESQPCFLCGDLPCITACEPRALLPLARPADARMGRLRLRTERCISVRDSHCDVCVSRCPVDPKPIAVRIGSAPVIDHDRCTGCGVCEWLCPASALEVLPTGASNQNDQPPPDPGPEEALA